MPLLLASFARECRKNPTPYGAAKGAETSRCDDKALQLEAPSPSL